MRNNSIIKYVVIFAVAVVSGIILAFTVGDLVKMNTYPKTEAVIDDIKVRISDDPDESDSYDVYVTYTVDGKNYRSLLNDYDASYKVGGKTEIHYNPDDPAEILSTQLTPIIIALVIWGVAFLVSAFLSVNVIIALIRSALAK